MSDKDKSTIQWIRESSIPIISTLVGSGLLLTVLSGLYSEFSQPNIHLGITPHYAIETNYTESKPNINYYEILMRNDGKTPATNLTFSMYFFGEIKNYAVSFTDEKLQSLKEVKTGGEASLVVGEMARLAPGAMTIINASVNTNKYDPYYISATFDQGSTSFPAFIPPDIESGRFPNILSANEGGYVVQQLIIISSILCIVSFTIAVVYKRIKEKIRLKREGRIHQIKEFDLLVAIPIIIICSILLLYICEELPKYMLIPSVIPPPIDITEGASLDAAFKYSNVEYKQRDLLSGAGIFWVIVVIARIYLSYLIAKILIPKIYASDPRWQLNESSKNILKISSIIIMGVPIDLTISLYFVKVTYVISPTYLFSIFFLLDIFRMLLLILIIPRISVRTNNLFYHTLSVISVLSGIIHVSLFFVFLRLDTIYTNDKFKSQFLQPDWYYFFLLVGLLSLSRLALITLRGRAGKAFYGGAVLSGTILIMWIVIIYYLTEWKDPILSIGLPIIVIGVLMFPLEGAYAFITRVVKVRKVCQPTLRIDKVENLRTSNSLLAGTKIPLGERMKVYGSLVYNDDRGVVTPISDCIIIIHNWKRKDLPKSPWDKTNSNGKFEVEISAPSVAENDIKIQAHSIGRSEWYTSRSILNIIRRFRITVYNSSDSKFYSYNTQRHSVTLTIETKLIYPDGKHKKKSDFRTGEIITFVVSIKDEVMNQPISDIDTIQIRFTGTDRTAKVLTPTNDNGETSISIPSPEISSLGWTYQAYYPGNSRYSNAYTNVGSYSTN